jgi:transposase
MMLPPTTRVYLACGFTDMRKGFDGLAAQVQTVLSLDPYGGALFVFRGRRGRHTTFHIQFASRDDCLSMASVVGADVTSVAASAWQRADVHLHDGAA